MSHLEALIERLRAEQDRLIRDAEAKGDIPSRHLLQQIGDLEDRIRAVETLIEDR
jgi:hypothetical protein